MAWPAYAMDTGFYNAQGSYDFDARCEIARELGFDATYLTLWSETAWNDVARLATVRERFDLDVAGVYCPIDMTAPDADAQEQRITDLLRTIEGTNLVEIALLSTTLKPSDEAGDDVALALLQRLADAAADRDITLLLYPHALCWLERTSDAVRLCRKMDHPRVRAIFTAYHWYAVEGGPELPRVIDDVAPFLSAVNICGSSKLPGMVMGATLERLDEGELDAFDVLAQVRRAGYDGYIGLQGYAVQGDPYANFRRSLAALRDIERRLDAHPHWGDLRRADPLPLPSGA
jgi:sugar phosphate isomerase/epimerase